MATDLGPPPPKTAPTQKYELFVDQQLSKTRRRIRSLDLTAGLLVLLSSLVLYLFLIGLLDRAWNLSAEIRSGTLLLYGLAALAFAGWLGWRLLSQEVNPYFAARRLEETLPATKNSVLNWLDLRHEPLPAAIRGSLGRRAAKDLTQADLERAVNPRRVFWLAGTLAVLLVALLVWFALSPGQFLSLVQRALAPFEKEQLRPPPSSAGQSQERQPGLLTREQDVPVRVEITGRVPGVNESKSPKIHYRYSADGRYSERPLDRDPQNPGEWTFTVKRDLIRTGLLYKLSAGDTETEEYDIAVIATPQVVCWQVIYQLTPPISA